MFIGYFSGDRFDDGDSDDIECVLQRRSLCVWFALRAQISEIVPSAGDQDHPEHSLHFGKSGSNCLNLHLLYFSKKEIDDHHPYWIFCILHLYHRHHQSISAGV